MEIPNEIMETIHKVVAAHSPKYKIPGYDNEDISQEAYLLAFKCYELWDKEIGPFENFLSRFLYNRLKTLVRDLTLNNSIYSENKKQLLSPLDISLVNWETEKNLIKEDTVSQNVENDEIIKKIDQYLPVSLRKDYLKMKAGVKVHRGRAKKIKLFITSLLNEFLGKKEEEEYE